jgi:DNA polymerase III sliding clamp (beta) subunit (PCNA family)
MVVGSINSVLFQIRKNQLMLWGSDGTMGMVTKVGLIDPASTPVDKLDVVFPVDKLAHIVSYSTTERVIFEEEKDRRWSIKTNSVFKVASYSEEHFPKFETKGGFLFKVQADDLNRYLKKVSPTMEEADDRPTLQGIYFDGNYVTTDRTRMSVYSLGGTIGSKGFIVPGTITSVLASFSKSEIEVEIVGNSSMLFKCGDTLVMTRLYEGGYPAYQPVIEKVISNTEGKMLMIDKKNFLEVMNRLKIFRDVNATVCLEVVDKKLIIQIGTDDRGIEEVKATIPEGFNLKWYLNIDSVFDFLNVLDGDFVMMKVVDERTPILIEEKYTTGDIFRCILSPFISR